VNPAFIRRSLTRNSKVALPESGARVSGRDL
jgi:hypothetical protein